MSLRTSACDSTFLVVVAHEDGRFLVDVAGTAPIWGPSTCSFCFPTEAAAHALLRSGGFTAWTTVRFDWVAATGPLGRRCRCQQAHGQTSHPSNVIPFRRSSRAE